MCVQRSVVQFLWVHEQDWVWFEVSAIQVYSRLTFRNPKGFPASCCARGARSLNKFGVFAYWANTFAGSIPQWPGWSTRFAKLTVSDAFRDFPHYPADACKGGLVRFDSLGTPPLLPLQLPIPKPQMFRVRGLRSCQGHATHAFFPSWDTQACTCVMSDRFATCVKVSPSKTY